MLKNLHQNTEDYMNSELREFYPLTSMPEFSEQMGGGFYSGTFNVIVGESGLGKTTLALRIVKDFGEQGIKTALFSSEMEVEDVQSRWLAMHDINDSDSECGYVRGYMRLKNKPENEARINHAFNIIRESQTAGVVEYETSFETILEKAVAEKIDDPSLKVIVIDHKDNLTTRGDLDGFRKDQYIIKHIQKLWKEYKLCVIMVSQLKKGTDKTTNYDKENIRGAGDWYFLANQIIYIWKSEDQHEWNQTQRLPGRPEQITFSFAKARYKADLFFSDHLVYYWPWKVEYRYGGAIEYQSKKKKKAL